MIDRRHLVTRGAALWLAGCAWPASMFAASDRQRLAREPYPVSYVDPRWLNKRWRRQIVSSPAAAPGTIIADARARLLYLVLGNGQALRYGIAVGREGFGWSGTSTIARKKKWPSWTTTSRMDADNGGLTYQIEGGPGNPLGARALYLYQDGKDTLYRLHGGGTRQTIGNAVSAGCIRLLDQDIIDLYDRVSLGTTVIVTDPRSPGIT